MGTIIYTDYQLYKDYILCQYNPKLFRTLLIIHCDRRQDIFDLSPLLYFPNGFELSEKPNRNKLPSDSGINLVCFLLFEQIARRPRKHYQNHDGQ